MPLELATYCTRVQVRSRGLPDDFAGNEVRVVEITGNNISCCHTSAVIMIQVLMLTCAVVLTLVTYLTYNVSSYYTLRARRDPLYCTTLLGTELPNTSHTHFVLSEHSISYSGTPYIVYVQYVAIALLLV